MGSCQGWLLEYGLGEDDQASDFIWASQIIDDPAVSSMMLGFDILHKEDNCSDNASLKKRNRTESCAAPGSKACREKMRRDRLNDRFSELCSILDPGRPAKADKVAILSDATHRLKQLRLEAQKLKDSNEALRESIKILKAEKSELRDKKMRLRAEKERLEQMLNGISVVPPFMAHPATAPFQTASFAACNKAVPYPNYRPLAMWQWIPPAALDTSQDHVLRPPVA